MKTFGVKYFHNACINYFSEKNKKEEVAKICMLETTMEKWFQGEVVLSLITPVRTTLQDEYKILSSDIYNETSETIDHWELISDDWKYVVAEAAVYNDSRKKADVVIEKDNEMLICEIKFFWIDDKELEDKIDFHGILKKILYKNEIFKDAEKFRSIDQSYKKPHLCLTLFGSIDKCFSINEKNINELMKHCFEKEGYKVNKIFSDIICSYKMEYKKFHKNWGKSDFDVFIISIDLSKI